jgi:hypothetical protein
LTSLILLPLDDFIATGDFCITSVGKSTGSRLPWLCRIHVSLQQQSTSLGYYRQPLRAAFLLWNAIN